MFNVGDRVRIIDSAHICSRWRHLIGTVVSYDADYGYYVVVFDTVPPGGDQVHRLVESYLELVSSGNKGVEDDA